MRILLIYDCNVGWRIAQIASGALSLHTALMALKHFSLFDKWRGAVSVCPCTMYVAISPSRICCTMKIQYRILEYVVLCMHKAQRKRWKKLQRKWIIAMEIEYIVRMGNSCAVQLTHSLPHTLGHTHTRSDMYFAEHSLCIVVKLNVK